MRRTANNKTTLRYAGKSPTSYVSFAKKSNGLWLEEWKNRNEGSLVNYFWFTPRQLRYIGKRLIEWADAIDKGGA
jgi:hypothetical protein